MEVARKKLVHVRSHRDEVPEQKQKFQEIENRIIWIDKINSELPFLVRYSSRPPNDKKTLLKLKKLSDALLQESHAGLKVIKEKNLPDCKTICVAANHVDSQVTLLWR